MLAENVQAAAVLSLVSGVFLAFLARVLCGILGVRTELSVIDYVIISTVGGIIAGVLLLGITVLVARVSVARGWDMDNIAAPMLTAAGDILTLPSLVVATYLIGIPVFSSALGVTLVLAAAAAAYFGLRLGVENLSRILAESFPILAMTGTVTILVGVALQDREEQFTTLLGLEHPSAGVLAGGWRPWRHPLQPPLLQGTSRPYSAARDTAVRGLERLHAHLHLRRRGLRVYRGGFAPHSRGSLPGGGEPGFLAMIGISALAGLIATTAAVFAAYYGSTLSYRLGLDPDTYGIPIITAAVDLLGFMSLIIALIVFGLAG